MNRSIALFVALAVLVAHALAIRTTATGDLAPPYDQAFAAFRVAKRWVYEGSFTWNPGQSGLESYPSTLWILLCGLGERLYLPITEFVRVIGVLATAASFILASRFHADRIASLITPMLLSISGIMAAAAVSGTETALLTMLLTLAFLAFERGWHWRTAVALLLCGLTRGEAWVLIPVFLLLRQRARRRERKGIEGPPAAPLWVFAVPVAGAVVMTLIRWKMTGFAASPWVEQLGRLDRAHVNNGLAYVRDFFVSAASPILLLYSLWYASLRRLSHTGAHALVVFIAWAGIIVLKGGGLTPFSESMVPVLPIALISAQEAMINALNSLRRPVRSLAWAAFVLAVLASALASLPSLPDQSSPLAPLQRTMSAASAAPRMGFEGALGRKGLDEELAATTNLRRIGLYLRDNSDASSSVLTPWPGSIGYLSQLDVRDLLGRTTPAPPALRPHPAESLPRVDVLAALLTAPDYVVPYWRVREPGRSLASLAASWSEEADLEPDSPERRAAITAELKRYEVITIPLDDEDGRMGEGLSIPILRRRELLATPRLTGTLEGLRLKVELSAVTQRQLADLAIRAVGAQAAPRMIDPSGAISLDQQTRARSNLLLSETGERAVTLFHFELPAEVLTADELQLVLLNPGGSLEREEDQVSGEARVSLP
jgi:hypothetical protein